jgi:hypothetical protein
MRQLLRLSVTHAIPLLVLTSCAANAPPAHDSRPRITGQVRRSENFGYSWPLPAQWEFVPAGQFGPVPSGSSIEVVAARRTGTAQATTELLVSDLITVPPRRAWGRPEDYDGLEDYGKQFLREKGALILTSRRLKMAGHAAVEVSGVLGEQAFSVRLLYRGRRRFEFRCVATAKGSGWPCESAYESFQIVDLQEQPSEGDTPRVLHLRDSRFGIEFDPPDDSWLAVGPRTGAGGAQVVWIWRKGNRQVDVQAFDLSIVPGDAPDEAVFARKLAEGFRAKGANVAMKESRLAGAPCHHLVVNRPDGFQQDMFILNKTNVNYAILITQPTRDVGLVGKVRNSFKLVAR